MAYLKTSAADLNELCAAIVSFAQANGWTLHYSERATNGIQFALSSGNCHVAVGEQSATANPTTVTDPYNGQSYQDADISIAIASSINPALKRYWGHPDSPITSAGIARLRTRVNDLGNAMTEVHLYGNSEYIHVCVLSATDRYTSFGFGNLVGASVGLPKIGYCFGSRHPFWDGTRIGNAAAYRKTCLTQYYSTDMGVFPLFPSQDASSYGWNFLQLYVPNGVLNTAYGFASGNRVYSYTSLAAYFSFHLLDITGGGANYNSGSRILDPAFYSSNQPTTGGIALHPFINIINHPNFSTNKVSTYLGNIPDLAYCNISDVELGADYNYGDDTWNMYPLKQRGTREGASFGAGYTNQPNTQHLGLAFKKVL